jgi:hypothetical protein
MSTSVRGVFTTDGSRFAGVVPRVHEVTAVAPAAKPKLPDQTMSILVELQGSTPADRAEWNALVTERHTLNLRTIAYIERQLVARHADLERRHEESKQAVRAQQTVLENLKKSLIEGSQESIRSGNAHRLQGSVAHRAEQDLQGLSRFASKAQVAAAEKNVNVANEKLAKTERTAAEWIQSLNVLQLVTIPAEQKKLAALMEAEAEIAAQLEGRDPNFAKFGFVLQR